MSRLLKLTILVIFFISATTLNAKNYLTKNEIKKLGKKYGGRSEERFTNWNNMMKINKSKSKLKQARNVDRYFNQYRYKGDFKFDSSGKKYKSDYLRSFYNFIGKYGGDCDDYAIMKYFSLIKLGVPENKLEIWIGGFRSNKINHAVLAYYVDGKKDPLILDSNTHWAVKMSKRTNFEPWIYVNRNKYGVMKKTLKKYKVQNKLHSYESYGDYFMLKMERWFRQSSF